MVRKNFIPSKAIQKAKYVDTSLGLLTIVNSKRNGRRIEFRKELVEKLGVTDTITVCYDEERVIFFKPSEASDTIDEIMYAKVKYKLSSAEFFEQLIKDASKHGIDYDSLKPKTDEEIKDAMSDDESSLKLILNDIGKKQNKKIIKEYLDKYVANPRECLDLYEPTKDDIVKAVKSCFHKKDIIGDSRTYNLYDDVDIEELLLPWSAYYALKKAGINIVGDLFQNDDDEIYNILGEELFEVVQRRLLTISIMILHECYKKQLKLQEESLVNTIEEIEESDTEKNISIDEMNLSVRSYNCLRRAGITDLYELMKMSSDDFMKIRNLGRKNFYEIIDKMAEYGVGPKDTVECKKNISEFDEVLIEDMELTVRSYNLLRRGGIKTLGDLTRITIDELLKIRNMGRKSLEEILRKMEAFGAKLRQVEEDEGEEDDEWGDLEEFCNDLFEECNKNYDDNQEQYFAESNNVEEDICSGCVTEVDDDKLEVEILNLNPVDMSPLGLVKTRKCDIAIGGAFICTDGIEIAFVFDNKRTSMVEASVYDIFINGNEVTAEGGSCVVFQTGKFLLKKIAKLLCNENQIIDITYKYNLRYNSSNNYFTKTEQVKLQSEYIRHQYSSDYKTQLVNVFSNEIWDVNYVGALLNNDDEKLIFLAKNKSDRKQLFSLCEMNVDGITMAINFGSIYVGAGETKLGLIEPENIFKYDISNKVVGLKATNTYSTYLDEEDKEYICEKICIGEIYDEMYGCAFLKQELKTHHKDYFKAGIRILTQFGELKIHKVIDCSDRWGLCYQLKCIFFPKVTGKVEFRMIINGFTFNENSIDCVNNEEAEITIPLSIKWLRRYGFIYEESYAMTFKVALEDEEDSELETVDEINYIFRMDEIINQSVKPEDGDE